MNKIPEQTYFNFEFDKESPEIITSTIDEILSIAKTKIKKPINKLFVLDVGSGAGQYAFAIEKYVKKVTAVEPFIPAYKTALEVKRKSKSKVNFLNIMVEDYKTNKKFDLVLCLATLEHMPNAEKAFKKIFELMKNGGVIYLTVPNKLWPFEQHHKLPFLSYLPLSLANFYVKIAKRGENFEGSAYAKSYFGIKKMFNELPCKYEFIIPDPNSPYLGLGSSPWYYQIMKNVGIQLLKKFPLFWVISKGFIIVAQKNSRD